MSDRLELRGKICATLQQNYVALLGQRGSGMDGLIRSILQRPTVANMKFVQVPLPRNISNESEFMDVFIESLVNMSTRIVPRGLAEGIKRVWEDHKHSGVEYRLRKSSPRSARRRPPGPWSSFFDPLPKLRRAR